MRDEQWVPDEKMGHGSPEMGRSEEPETWAGVIYLPDPSSRSGWRQMAVYRPVVRQHKPRGGFQARRK